MKLAASAQAAKHENFPCLNPGIVSIFKDSWSLKHQALLLNLLSLVETDGVL